MTTEKAPLSERLRDAWRALVGEAPTSAAGALRGRIAALEADVRERDERLEAVQREFEIERRRGEDTAAGAGREELEKIARKVAPLLSQLGTLEALQTSGREPKAADVLKLFGKIRDALCAFGLEPIGEVGAVEEFDSARHQRMSGGDVADGDQVKVRFVGYRFGEKVLSKAMVSREE